MPVAQSARFSVDYKQKYVEWMGFSFYMTFDYDTGLQLFDIRFKGERIIYELGIQEALAHYAGNDPVMSGTSYLDSAYGLGYANELMPGYDCPTYASYLNITIEGSYGKFKDINGTLFGVICQAGSLIAFLSRLSFRVRRRLLHPATQLHFQYQEHLLCGQDHHHCWELRLLVQL
jgi:Cu2+-containing amine oxidase